MKTKDFLPQINNTHTVSVLFGEHIVEHLLCTDNLDEGWKDWVAGAAMGLATLGGGHHKSQEVPTTPAIQQSMVQSPEEKSILQTMLKPAAKTLISAGRHAGMKGSELAQFIAQCAHETGDFVHMAENGNKNAFNKYDPSVNPSKAKVLGNTEAGDGAKFKGRGYIQLTGRYNYTKAAQALGIPLDKHPEMVEDPAVAAKVAVWYWKTRVAPKVSDFSDTAATTKTINSQLAGLHKRNAIFNGIINLMKKRGEIET